MLLIRICDRPYRLLVLPSSIISSRVAGLRILQKDLISPTLSLCWKSLITASKKACLSLYIKNSESGVRLSTSLRDVSCNIHRYLFALEKKQLNNVSCKYMKLNVLVLCMFMMKFSGLNEQRHCAKWCKMLKIRSYQFKNDCIFLYFMMMERLGGG